MGTSAQDKQRANPGSARLECGTCYKPSTSRPAPSPGLSRSGPLRSLCYCHFRRFAASNLPPEASSCALYRVDPEPIPRTRRGEKNASNDPSEPAYFHTLFWGEALIGALFLCELTYLKVGAENKARTQPNFRRTEIATNNQEAAGLRAVPGSPFCSRGHLPGFLSRGAPRCPSRPLP